MILIWRGWGILALLLLVAGGALGSAVGGSMNGSGSRLLVALGVLAGAVACWYAGQRLNVTGPRRRVEEYGAARAAELHRLADEGTFHLGAGYAPPTSYAEAHAQADMLVNSEVAAAARHGRNRHTFFFVPLQYWAVVGGIVAALIAAGVFH